jgi:hypothetical protein
MRTGALVLAASILGACSSSNGHFEQQPASNTGQLAFIAAGSTPRLYVPAQPSATDTRTLLAVVDPTAAHGTSGLIHYIDLGTTSSFVKAVGGDGHDVVAVDAIEPTIYFIDAATDTLRQAVTLPDTAQPMFSSSGVGAYSMGAAVDAAGRRAFVSSSLGLLRYDLDSRSLTGTFEAPSTEGFALDGGAGRLYSAFYLCDPGGATVGICDPVPQPGGPDLTSSLNITDVAAHRTYGYVDPAAADPHMPLGFESDAVAVHFPYGMAVVATESLPALNLIDLEGLAFDDQALTCSGAVMTIPTPDTGYTEMAIDTATNLLVVGQENGNTTLFVDLAAARRGTVSTLLGEMPLLPDGGQWYHHGDVHAATIGIVGGRPYAFMAFGDPIWIARIDLIGVRGVLAGQGQFAETVEYISVPVP